MKIKSYLIGITKNLIKKKYRELSNDVFVCDISDFCNSEESLINVFDIAEEKNVTEKEVMEAVEKWLENYSKK